MYKSICIIQARVNSTRLPGKIFLPFYKDFTILDTVINKAKQMKFDKIIVATGSEELNSGIKEITDKNAIDIFYGDEDDVLKRFYYASEKYPSKYIVRITADNPFIDVEIALQTMYFITSQRLDYAVIDGTPLGTSCEIFTKELLDITHKKAKTPHDREHVTSYIINNNGRFKYKRFLTSQFGDYYKLRLTLDTPSDFKKIFSITKQLKTYDIDFREVIKLLEKDESLKKYMTFEK